MFVHNELFERISSQITEIRTVALIDALTSLWEASVRATHQFLAEDDIQRLIPFVKMGLLRVETLIITSTNNKPTALMGVEAGKIEMLFVSPGCFGKGIGRELAELAISQYEVRYVDVNEQNTPLPKPRKKKQ